MKFLHNLISQIEPPNWVMGIMALVLLTRIPTFFEPYFYGDEMIYLTLGNAVHQGLTLYKQIHDNKPPLLYMTAALAGNLFWLKAILAFWMLATLITFWHLAKELFKDNPLAQKVSVIVFAILTTIPLFEGNIVNAELFLIGPIILAIFILLSKPTIRNIFISGLLFGVAALFKIPAVFDVPVVVLFWLVTTKLNKDEIIEIIKKTFILALGLLIPILISLIWYFFKGALGDYIKAAFLENLGYINTWNGVSQGSFLVKHGPLLIRASIILIGLVILRVFNKKLNKSFMIATIWLLTSLFAVTLSQRPYPHYMIQAVPAIALLIGILVSSNKIEQVLSVIPLTIAIVVPIYYQFYYYPTFSYYQRFAQFATGKISKWEFFNEFDPTTKGNYDTAQTITKLAVDNEKVFIWGNDAPTIYALSRHLPPIKYVADYHITDFSSLSQTASDLSKNPPPLIVILPNSPNFKELQNLLTKKYIIISSQNNTQIWHLISL